jgi:hypothetical protein
MRSSSSGRPLSSLVVAGLAAGCDPSWRPLVEDNARSVPAQTSAAETGTEGAMLVEDVDDHAILNDSSNLQPPGMARVEYESVLQQRARAEIERAFPGVVFATPEDAQRLSLRWFVQGAGVVVQSSAKRMFYVGAQFWAVNDEDCSEAVISKEIGPAEAIVLRPKDSDCELDRASVTVRDEFGLFVDVRVLTPEDTQ